MQVQIWLWLLQEWPFGQLSESCCRVVFFFRVAWIGIFHECCVCVVVLGVGSTVFKGYSFPYVLYIFFNCKRSAEPHLFSRLHVHERECMGSFFLSTIYVLHGKSFVHELYVDELYMG